MFTGIIEATGKVISTRKEKSNLVLEIECPFVNELKVDQSVAHNGVCLTVEQINGNTYSLTAIEETLQKSNIGELKVGDEVNLERCMQLGGRLDGHIVQGHVDGIGTCVNKENKDGSWLFTFSYPEKINQVTVEKGSITINGVSLTVVNSLKNEFSVAIIPYTYEHTNFKNIEVNHQVNLEFDVIGKYVKKILDFRF